MASELDRITGTLSFLRVNDVGTGFGPSQDFIDVEVVIMFAGQEDAGAFGFKLRNDDNGRAHQGMLDLLRDAFANEFTVAVDFEIDREFGRKNGFIIRVELTK